MSELPDLRNSPLFDLKWGSNGIDGTEPLKVRALRDLDTSHLQNILFTCGWHIGEKYKSAILMLLELRGAKTFPNITDKESKTIYNGYVTKRNHITGEHIPLASV